MDHLHLRNNEQTAFVQRLILQASSIVMSHCKLTAIPATWVDEGSPPAQEIPFKVRSATLLVISELNENREASGANPVSQAVVDILADIRLPTLA